MYSLHFAPVQGHTDAAYRHFHAEVYGKNSAFYTPFIRLEKDGIRPRDIKDVNSEMNNDLHLVPQIIFRDEKELTTLIDLLKVNGNKEINLNMGCPFPLQTSHGRGAATIANLDLARKVVKTVKDNPEIKFSVKMRLGMQDPEEWKKLLPYLNELELEHITLHPRVAKQQYGGEIDFNQFESFLGESKNRVIYNGDIHSPEDMESILGKYPEVEGIMVARGILGRPSLFNEFIDKKEWDKETRISKMLDFHRRLFNHYSSVLCGDAQIISKIQPFWEYAEDEIGRKAWKAIKKASNLAKYQSAVAMV